MPVAALKPSAHLKVQRVSSLDEFKAIGFVEFERFTLLGPYFYERAITALPGVHLMLEKTYPRSFSATMNAMGCTIIVPMRGQVDAAFNGRTWSSFDLGLLRNQTAFDLREPHQNIFAVIRFSSDMQNRGWDEAEGRLHLRSAGREDLSWLQHVIQQIFVLSSSMPHREFVLAAEALRQGLIDALDRVLTFTSARRPGSRSFERYRNLVSRLDEFVRSRPEIPLYSEALAKEIGTSVRTLQLAVQEIHGATLHQHLRIRRLWSLRAQLAKGSPMTSVSSAGMANGFLHMGELSRLYKATFGESPSETLLRSRGV